MYKSCYKSLKFATIACFCHVKATRISPASDELLRRKSVASCFNNRSIIQSCSKLTCQILAGSGFLNVKVRCFSLSFMVINEQVFGFGWTKKQFEDISFRVWEIVMSTF